MATTCGDTLGGMSDTDVRIGKRLQDLRGETSQAGLAAAMADRGHKLSQATVWSVETAKRPLRLAEAEDVADILGVRVDALLARDDFEQQVHALTTAAHEVSVLGSRISYAVLEYLMAQNRLRDAVESLPEPPPDAAPDLFKWRAGAVSTALGELDFPPEVYLQSALDGAEDPDHGIHR